jgi:hypothetical protein
MVMVNDGINNAALTGHTIPGAVPQPGGGTLDIDRGDGTTSRRPRHPDPAVPLVTGDQAPHCARAAERCMSSPTLTPVPIDIQYATA